jgi:hypothetical protein
MLDHEVPYKEVLHKVEIPTETWPAQDIRKSNVFKFAAKYAEEPLRGHCLKQSEFFFNACITDLLSFSTHTLTRPIVLLMTNISMHAYFAEHPNEMGLQSDATYDYGKPADFTPRLYELYQAREKMHAVMDVWRTLRRRLVQSSSICDANAGGLRG